LPPVSAARIFRPARASPALTAAAFRAPMSISPSSNIRAPPARTASSRRATAPAFCIWSSIAGTAVSANLPGSLSEPFDSGSTM